VALCHHCFAIPILAELHAGAGAKFVTLARRTGASRDALVAALRALRVRRLARRHAGYGHPLRPEYVVAPGAAAVAARCLALRQVLAAWPGREAFGRKWALPVVAVLGGGPARFAELARALPGVTARALATTLRALQAAGAVARAVTADYPPACTYRLTPAGRRCAPAVRALAAAVAAHRRGGTTPA
jgi:DNA-binding HxlR family transcriptional regulator